MKNVVLLLLVGMAFACNTKKKETENEFQKPMETKTENEWIPLFDGRSFEGWHYYRGNAIEAPWQLEDGAMVFYPPETRNEGESFNIVTDSEFTDFVLSLEWKISDGGNSGIFWGVYESEAFGKPYETGPEIQVLDNLAHPDAKNGTTHQAGALYDLVAPSADVVKPVGEWNHCVLTVNHTTNEGNVVLNGTAICTFPLQGALWDEMVANSKFADWEGFGKYTTGKIGLQDHGDIVAYRNIKIKEL
ncbi:MAG: DUF1080 domain-containing protein [Bacteroidota bacterium]